MKTSAPLLPILRRSLAACSIALGLTAAVPAHADVVLSSGVTLLMNSGGFLTGAKQVLVNGARYDVTFVDGTCIALFSGCDATTDFLFQAETSARLAAQALLDQVFLDFTDSGIPFTFDSKPQAMRGCSLPPCFVQIPYVLTSQVGYAYALNATASTADLVSSSSMGSNNNLTTQAGRTWAIWMPLLPQFPNPPAWPWWRWPGCCLAACLADARA